MATLEAINKQLNFFKILKEEIEKTNGKFSMGKLTKKHKISSSYIAKYIKEGYIIKTQSRNGSSDITYELCNYNIEPIHIRKVIDSVNTKYNYVKTDVVLNAKGYSANVFSSKVGFKCKLNTEPFTKIHGISLLHLRKQFDKLVSELESEKTHIPKEETPLNKNLGEIVEVMKEEALDGPEFKRFSTLLDFDEKVSPELKKEVFQEDVVDINKEIKNNSFIKEEEEKFLTYMKEENKKFSELLKSNYDIMHPSDKEIEKRELENKLKDVTFKNLTKTITELKDLITKKKDKITISKRIGNFFSNKTLHKVASYVALLAVIVYFSIESYSDIKIKEAYLNKVIQTTKEVTILKYKLSLIKTK